MWFEYNMLMKTEHNLKADVKYVSVSDISANALWFQTLLYVAMFSLRLPNFSYRRMRGHLQRNAVTTSICS